MIRYFAKLARDTRGASAVEYALIVALIVLAIIGGVTMFADNTIAMWNGVSENVSTA